MNEDKIKESFIKVREDMAYFFEEMQEIKRTLEELTTQIAEIQTFQHKNPTHSNTPTQEEGFKPKYFNTSTGNEGVPTNRPTDQQTIQHPIISTGNAQNPLPNSHFITKKEENQPKNRLEHLQRVSEILESLDELKKEVRFKFKKLTNQEMLVFSVIYQLDELGIYPDYALIAEKTGLTETSIRDYIRKIIKKGIPLVKDKEGNKKIVLKIPKDLKKVASLNTILELREL